MTSIQNFETVESLLNRLSRKNPDRKTGLKPIVSHHIVEFTGSCSSKSEELKDFDPASKDHTSKPVLKPNQIHIINFSISDSSSERKLITIVSLLEALVFFGHSEVLVTIGMVLIEKKTNPDIYQLKVRDYVLPRFTELNPYKKHEKFKSQLNKVKQLLGEEGSDLIIPWIRKKIPESYDLFVVEDEFYHGKNSLTQKYSFNFDQLSRIFISDSLSPQLYICNLTKNQMIFLFGRRVQREDMVYKVLDRMLERKNVETQQTQQFQTEQPKQKQSEDVPVPQKETHLSSSTPPDNLGYIPCRSCGMKFLKTFLDGNNGECGNCSFRRIGCSKCHKFSVKRWSMYDYKCVECM